MNGLSGDQLTRQLISLHRVINSKDRHSLAQMVKTVADLDLTLPLRGVTALSLSLFIRQPAITKDLLTYLHRLGQLSRAINMTSVDNTHRRETPLITAARTGQSESVELLLLYKDILDLESKDGEGRTAIWNAVREENFGIVMQLVENGARIHYDNGDLSCPLQLACKTHLLKARGKQIVRYLVSHGANLEFVDHALRNALYWAIYHSCGETAVFLLKAGIKVKPWLWLGDDALPNSVLEDKANLSLIRTVRSEPRELKILARTVVRNWLISQANSRSIYPRIDSLSLGEKGRALLRLDEILNLKIRSSGTTATAGGTGKTRAK
ncbi:uncharacterized protein LOC131883842 [Tigriopus californicus]|nr:uncharacterized protein LOC131883842 [Tigriopus californicus]XP_059087418.1 uncharacterized protein LOC131883842 [Tigriopus californicus]XP_059087419.1 uncharacterized protein LOC131883842 [Tigriopus californicus]